MSEARHRAIGAISEILKSYRHQDSMGGVVNNYEKIKSYIVEAGKSRNS